MQVGDYHIHESASIDEYRTKNSIFAERAPIQLTRGPFQCRIETLSLGDMWLTKRTSSQMVCQFGEIPERQLAFSLIAGCRPFFGTDGTPFSEGEIAASWRPRRFQHILPPRVSFYAIRFKESVIVQSAQPRCYQELAKLLKSETPQKFICAETHNTVVKQIDALFATRQQGPLETMEDDFKRQLVDAILEGVNSKKVVTARANSRSRILQRSLEQLLNTPANEICLDNIAHTLGTSRRNLELIYAERLQLSPNELINNLRLNAARQDLLNARPGDTVSAVAQRCGIKHLGNFAKNYHDMFGELPSNTIRRAKYKA